MKRLTAIALACGLAIAIGNVPSAGSAATSISQQQADELTASYAYLVTDFYKKVDAQSVLDGAHTSLVTFLKAQGVKNPAV
jgi:hypothetical protein